MKNSYISFVFVLLGFLLWDGEAAAANVVWSVSGSISGGGISQGFSTSVTLPESGGSSGFSVGPVAATVITTASTFSLRGGGFGSALGATCSGSGGGRGIIRKTATTWSSGGSLGGLVHCEFDDGTSDNFSVSGSFSASASAPGTSTAPTLTSVSGNVEVTVEGVTESATTSLQLSEGMKVKTGSTGQAEITLDDGSRIVLDPNSSFTLRSEESDSSLINQLIGKIRYVFHVLKCARNCRVLTPTVAVAVRGTDFTVEYSESGRTGTTTTTVQSGTVEVDDQSGGTTTLSAGEQLDTVGALPNLAAAVLPASRSIQLGGTATAFGTIINAGPGTAINCQLAPLTSVPATFTFQTTDPATNVVTGTPDASVDIAAGASQSFVFALTPTGEVTSTDVQLSFQCTDSNSAPITVGLNTLLFSASDAAVPDVVALAATTSNDGIVNVPGVGGTGAFAVATVNVGSSASITASADDGGAGLPVEISICETNPSTGACISAIGSSVTTTIGANATPTFGIFVKANQAIALNAATGRIFVRFKDSGGVTRGSTSVAVQTQ